MAIDAEISTASETNTSAICKHVFNCPQECILIHKPNADGTESGFKNKNKNVQLPTQAASSLITFDSSQITHCLTTTTNPHCSYHHFLSLCLPGGGGVGWDCQAIECSPLAQGGCKRKRATIRLQALSHYRFTARLALCIWEHIQWLR